MRATPENVADLCRRINFDDAVQIGSGRDRDLLALDGALNTLARRDPRKVRMIELPGPAPRRLVEWEIVDPYGRPIEAFRKTRDTRERKVMDLILSLRKEQLAG